jgi:hypothetical protein
VSASDGTLADPASSVQAQRKNTLSTEMGRLGGCSGTDAFYYKESAWAKGEVLPVQSYTVRGVNFVVERECLGFLWPFFCGLR